MPKVLDVFYIITEATETAINAKNVCYLIDLNFQFVIKTKLIRIIHRVEKVRHWDKYIYSPQINLVIEFPSNDIAKGWKEVFTNIVNATLKLTGALNQEGLTLFLNYSTKGAVYFNKKPD